MGQTVRQLFSALSYTNIYSKIGNGYGGWPDNSPFDAIIITAAAPQVVGNLLGQLKIGGNIIMPLEVAANNQILVRITKLDANNNYTQTELLAVTVYP